jgi:hypothetical protein
MTIEPIIHQLNLGQPIEKYKRPLLEYPQISYGFALGIPFFLLGLLIMIPALIDPGSYTKGAAKAGLYLALPALCAIAFSLVNYFINQRNAQVLYEQGFIDIHQGKVPGMRYDAITEVYQRCVGTNYKNVSAIAQISGLIALFSGSPTTYMNLGTPLYHYRLRSPDSVIESRMPEMGDRVKIEVFKHLSPQILRNYENSNEIHFGPLSLSAQGLKTPKERLSWSGSWTIEAEIIAAQSTFIVIKRVQQSGWFSKNPIVWKSAMGKIVNFDIFWNLVTHLHENQGKLQRDYVQQLFEATPLP